MEISYYEIEEGEFVPKEGPVPFDIPLIGKRLDGGDTWYRAVANFTEYPILLKSGYSTVANGGADNIVCPPMATIQRVMEGDAYDFSVYRIKPLYAVKEGYEDRINFRGTDPNEVP